jgi:copper homeostasis protein
MKQREKYLLEISVESVEAAAAAERGGAGRIEFCANTREGGTTPSAESMRLVRQQARIPIFAMIRPRAGDFSYSDDEFERMKQEVDTAKRFGMDGVVLGLLRRDGRVDLDRSKELVERAGPLPVTFHRAFDECVDLRSALEDVIRTGATRVLTSGGKPTAPEAWDVLRDLVRIAGERVGILPGSGIHAGNIADAVQRVGAGEYHAGLSSVVKRPAENVKAFEDEVRKVVDILADCKSS